MTGVNANEDEQIQNKLQTMLDLISNIQTAEQMRAECLAIKDQGSRDGDRYN